jgi:autotransporter passenger strand-loop-strand repeat protein
MPHAVAARRARSTPTQPMKGSDGTSKSASTDRVSGTDDGAILSGTQIVSRTGVASGATVFGHGSQTDLGTTVATVLYGGTETVSSGGSASNTTVYSGGSLRVLSRGLADPATIYSGGSETISKGGTDLGAEISGGVQIDSGLASGAVIFAGSQVVGSGGTAVGTRVWSGATEIVSSGGTTSGTVLSGGQETVLRGGHATGTIISSGGSAVATKISGGTLEVAAAVPPAVSSSPVAAFCSSIREGTSPAPFRVSISATRSTSEGSPMSQAAAPCRGRKRPPGPPPAAP